MEDMEPRPFDRPGRLPVIGSTVVHVLAVLLAWWTQTSHAAPVEYVTYEIDLVSPPPSEVAEEPQPAQEEELVVEAPEPDPVETESEEDPLPPPPEEESEPEEAEPEPEEPEPEPPREQPAEPTPTPEPAETPSEATTDEPAEEAAESGEDLNVRIEGLRRDYPAYYNNIIRQMRRCFRWKGQGSPTTVLRFVIEQDGTIATNSIEVVRPSGNVEFDFEMMGTVECASGRLGPLPEDYPFPELPIQFSFAPDAVREDADA